MRKLNILFALFLIALSIILGKLFVVQILARDQYGSNNTLRSHHIAQLRGEILDVHHQLLATNEIKYRLFAEPQKIEDKDEVIEEIEKVLGVGEATLSAKLDTKKVWVSLANGVDLAQKQTIERLDLLGLGFEEEQERFYPEASAAAHLLGFVGKNESGDPTGYFGIEGKYDKDLTGIPGIVKTERDLLGKPIFIGVQDTLEGEDGRDLVLTVDKSVQAFSKQVLLDGVERYGAEGGCIIVVNPKGLSVLALTCLPDYDPTEYYSFSQEYFTNPAIASLQEPGSIFKPLIVAAALNEGAIEPSEIFPEKGPIKIGGYSISTWDDKYEGTVSVTRALEKSSNVVMVEIGEKLGKEKLLDYLQIYGIGEKTGIDLQGEAAPILKSKNAWYPIDVATATFGQGIAINRMQMVRAFAALINGGFLHQPHIVKQIISSNGDVKTKDISPPKRILTAKTSKTIRAMLEKTVRFGEVKWDVPKGYRIGGKTGTAQVPIAGYYDPTKTVASFIGFSPVDDPELLILVSLDKPTTSIWGSETAAPLFFELIEKLFVYYGMPPR